jgi:hypothetical protein
MVRNEQHKLPIAAGANMHHISANDCSFNRHDMTVASVHGAVALGTDALSASAGENQANCTEQIELVTRAAAAIVIRVNPACTIAPEVGGNRDKQRCRDSPVAHKE